MQQCNEFLQKQAQSGSDKPFFLYCSIDIPHPQYYTNATFAAMVNNSAIPTPTWLDWDDMHLYDQYMTISKCLLPNDCAGLSTNSSDPYVTLIRQTWFAMCSEVCASQTSRCRIDFLLFDIYNNSLQKPGGCSSGTNAFCFGRVWLHEQHIHPLYFRPRRDEYGTSSMAEERYV